MEINRSLTARHLTRRNSAIKGIVLHDTAGSGTHNDTRYLANPSDGRQVSADFTVEKTGAVYQLNPNLTGNATFHAGRATSFKGAKNAAVNHISIGIEIVQHKDYANYPPAQVKAVAELCKYLCAQFNLSPSDITTHRQIITDGSRTDPRSFPFGDFWQYFNNSSGQSQNANNQNNQMSPGMIAVGFLILVLLLD